MVESVVLEKGTETTKKTCFLYANCSESSGSVSYCVVNLRHGKRWPGYFAPSTKAKKLGVGKYQVCVEHGTFV